MDKYYLFDNKICNNGVAMGNRSVVESLNHLFKENQSLQKSISEQHNKIADLEAKLAKNKKWIASNEGFLENQKLKQQLAESKRKYEDRKQFCIIETRSLTEIINNLLEENQELKTELTEKEKEIKELKKQDNKEKQSAGDIFVSMFEAFEKLSDQQINELKGEK